mmetsp:Transcript_47156/g.116716  ORF Transcript_47156/g.116716 Transcript_47156/m.116716 type:complete len:345 (+) Transcript_47156:146-1180(+)
MLVSLPHALSPLGGPLLAAGCLLPPRCAPRRSREVFAQEDDREAMFSALFAKEVGANKEEDSHKYIEKHSDGTPAKARYTYVDEHTCIGCTYCTQVARNTFFLEEDYGRARVYQQDGDSDDTIQEAIDSCPVNCIHYVSYEDLVTLEQERTGQVINNKARLVNQQEARSGAPPSRATFFDSAGVRCNNCPSRGCKECPMFGVGQNPVYMERLAQQKARREASGEAKLKEEEVRRAELIGNMFDAELATVDEPAELSVVDVQEEAFVSLPSEVSLDASSEPVPSPQPSSSASTDLKPEAEAEDDNEPFTGADDAPGALSDDSPEVFDMIFAEYAPITDDIEEPRE